MILKETAATSGTTNSIKSLCAISQPTERLGKLSLKRWSITEYWIEINYNAGLMVRNICYLSKRSKSLSRKLQRSLTLTKGFFISFRDTMMTKYICISCINKIKREDNLNFLFRLNLQKLGSWAPYLNTS